MSISFRSTVFFLCDNVQQSGIENNFEYEGVEILFLMLSDIAYI